MDERQLKELARIGGERIQFDCPMDRYTTFRVGGSTEALYPSPDVSDLKRIISWLSKESIPYITVGKGSNLLVKDGGFKGVVIILTQKMAVVEKDGKNDRLIHVGGGASISRLTEYCEIHELGGLEFLAGIPGTVGGAVAMNAGAFGKDMGSMVQGVLMVTPKGELTERDRTDLKFTYRKLFIPEGSVIAGARFELNSEKRHVISGKVADYLKRRKETQPLEYPSGGSVFKNPPDDYAARLIEKVGLKGKRIGGAAISDKHANFIVNIGGAKAKDILTLMDLAREKVREETGIELEPEIKVVGE